MTTRRSQQKENTRVQILRAAQYLFARNGFDETRTMEIASLVGVSHGTIFAHFESKAGILRSMIFDRCKDWVETLERSDVNGETAIDCLKALLHQLWEQHQKDTSLTRIYQSHAWVWDEVDEAEFRDLVDRVKGKAQTIISAGIKAKEIHREIDMDRVLDLLEASYFEALRRAKFDADGEDGGIADVEATMEYLLQQTRE